MSFAGNASGFDNALRSGNQPADTGAVDIDSTGGVTAWLGMELYYGGGIMDDLSRVPPEPPIPFRLGRGAMKLEGRLRGYVGPIGAWAIYDFLAKTSRLPDEDGVAHVAKSHSVQLLGSVHVELFGRHLRLEPLFGYGWLTDWAESTDESDRTLYSQWHRWSGLVAGIRPVVRFGKGYEAAALFTYGNYENIDRRLKLEFRWTWSEDKPEPFELVEKGKDVYFFTLGLHLVRKGDGRVDRMVYFGVGWLWRLASRPAPGARDDIVCH